MNQDYACKQHRNYGPKEKQEDHPHIDNNNILREIMFWHSTVKSELDLSVLAENNSRTFLSW